MSMQKVSEFQRRIRVNNPVLGHSIDENGFSFEVYVTWKQGLGVTGDDDGEILVTSILRARDESGAVHDMAHIMDPFPVTDVPSDFEASERLACLTLWRCWAAMLRHPAFSIRFTGSWGGSALVAL